MIAIRSAACAFALATCCVLPPLQAAMPDPLVGRDLVTEPVDAAHLTALPQSHAAWARPDNDMGEVAADAQFSHLSLVLRRSAERQLAFDQFLEQQQNPGSPNFHHWLTPVEVGQQFGASEHDIDALTQWLEAQGLQVEAVANSRVRIDFSGSAARVGAAFGTRLHAYLVDKQQRIAPAGTAQIPAALSPIVQSVVGLTTTNLRPQHRVESGPRLLSPPGSVPRPEATFCTPDAPCHYIFPGDFAAIYDLNPVYQQGINGASQTIAIVGRARVYLPDIENFQGISNLPVKDPVIVVVPGGIDPGPALSSGGTAPPDQAEATFDVARATSVAPGATILLAISANSATSDGVSLATQYVVDTNPPPAQILSISFNSCEMDNGQSGVTFFDSIFSQAAAEGISVFVGSGDTGAAGCDPNSSPPAMQTASINALCSSSYATCVGGTEFADTANPSAYWRAFNGVGDESAIGYIPEGAWNEPLNTGGMPQLSASGGGVSVYIPTPAWQAGLGVPGTQGRYTPDVSFSASAHDAYFGCLAAAGDSCVGQSPGAAFAGTSATAPNMAGIAALLNQKTGSAQGNLNPGLYALAGTPSNGVFHDVTVATSGVGGCSVSTPSMCNNSTPGPGGLSGGLAGYAVGPGYDEVTGLGSIDVANLLAQWPSVVNYQGLWWAAPAGMEAGWGINFAHQGDIIFASWFTYDLTGKGLWLVMTANKTAPGVYAGDFFTTTGPPFSAVPFNPSLVVATKVGTGILTFSSARDGTFDYTVYGIHQVKAITRQLFGPLPTCASGVQPNLALASNHTGLWWAAPAAIESGWGINFTQQGNTIFATWFTYNLDGTPLWLVVTASNTTPGVYSGTLYMTTGPPFNSVPFPPNYIATPVGTATLTFANGNSATFSYTVNTTAGPVSQVKAITQEVFRLPGTVCQ